MTIKWRGDELIRKKNKAIAMALNIVAKQSVLEAINNHPGWISGPTTKPYRTGLAEGSIRVKDHATARKREVVWGSVWGGSQFSNIRVSRRTGRLHTSNYVWYLEFDHGSFLRNAADKIYPTLTKVYKRQMKLIKRGLK